MQQHTVTSWTSSKQLAAKSIWINLNSPSVFVLSPKAALTSMFWDEWTGVKHFSDGSPQVGWQQWRFEGVDGTWWNDGTTWNLIFQLIFQYVPICSNISPFWPFGVGMVSEWSRKTLAVLVRPSWSLPRTNSTVRLCNDRFHWVCFEHELQPDGSHAFSLLLFFNGFYCFGQDCEMSLVLS